MLKANYHTHTELCGHAVGSVHDYVEEAVKLGFDELGMSDHAHTPEHFMSHDDYLRHGLERIMTNDDFDNIYKPQVLKEKERKDIKVYLGLETEYFPENHDYFVNLRKKVDYLVLGLHFFNYDGKSYSTYFDMDEKTILMYTDVVVKAMSTGLYTIFAHPDLYMHSYQSPKGDRVFDEVCADCAKRIIDSAIENDVYLEVNANGIQNTFRDYPSLSKYLYPREEFWEMVRDTDAKIVIGADAHKPEALGNEIVKEVIEFAERLNLKVLDHVTLKAIE